MVWKQGAAVAIWGSGLNAEKVYVKYAGKYDIRIVVDNFKNKDNVFNKKIVSAEEFFATQEYNGLKIIIASDKWKEISEQLKEKGLRAGEDFLPYIMLNAQNIEIKQVLELCKTDEIENFIECMKQSRKMAIFWGNCQINGITEFCLHNEEFDRKFMVLCFPNLWCTKQLLEVCDCEAIWKKCDLLVVQKIRTDNYMGIQVSDEYRCKYVLNLNGNCKIVKVPNLHFSGYYPQVVKEDRKALTEIHWEGVHCYDGNIFQMTDQGMSEEEIVAQIEKEDFYSEEYVKDFFETQLNNIKEYENDCDVKIADYLNKDKILYYSPMHPHVEVVREVAIRTLKCLCIGDVQIKEQERLEYHLEKKHYFHRTEYIYPSVLKALNIQNYKDEHRVNTYLFDKTISGRELLNIYIAVCKGYKE